MLDELIVMHRVVVKRQSAGSCYGRSFFMYSKAKVHCVTECDSFYASCGASSSGSGSIASRRSISALAALMSSRHP